MTTTEKITPMLFSDDMVKAILSGGKRQTRRVVSPSELRNLTRSKDAFGMTGSVDEHLGSALLLSTPFGLPGDFIWVRETWAPFHVGQKHDIASAVENIDDADAVRYRADGSVWMCGEQADICVHKSGEVEFDPHRWRPSIHMPKWACRLWLHVDAVRIERLQAITDSDARAEGVEDREAFNALWSSIYGHDSWASNPHVWVVTFTKGARP